MNVLHAFIIGSVWLIFNPDHAFAEMPSKIQASYDVTGYGMTLAQVAETFTRDGDSYRIESVTKAVGMLARFKPETVRVTSQGKITANGLQPRSYSMTREIDTGKNASAKFNWDKAILTHTDYKGVNDMPLPPGTLDRLSLLYQLPLLVRSGKNELDISLTDGNNLEPYHFTFATDTQNTRTPLGTFKTRLISNIPLATEVRYEIWLADERENFPCKVIVTDSAGGKLTQVLTDLTIAP